MFGSSSSGKCRICKGTGKVKSGITGPEYPCTHCAYPQGSGKCPICKGTGQADAGGGQKVPCVSCYNG